MDFGTAKAWKQINLAHGEHKYEKVWVGGQRTDDAMIMFSDSYGDILVEIVFTNTRGPKFFTIPIVHQLIELV
jgi:hypothetical protein|tara:strand:- start:1003 stop:1221 length:219 start_codon:yes stop_codon:yes gene_type:complete